MGELTIRASAHFNKGEAYGHKAGLRFRIDLG